MIVEESPEAGYVARLTGAAIFTEANDRPSLRDQIRDAVGCHFDATGWPSLILLHITREETIAGSDRRGRNGDIGESAGESGTRESWTDHDFRLPPCPFGKNVVCP